jgi:catechol 2,3-dioxygenase
MTRQNSGILPAETHIGRTALLVSDLDRMTDFYRTVVGLDVVRESGNESALGVENRPLLVLQSGPDAEPNSRSGTGLYHNAFRVPTRGAIGDALGRVREHWQLDGASDHLVSEALYLTDPEGNGIEIYRDFPRDQWPTSDEGMIEMTTDPLDLDAIAAAATGASQAPPETDVGHVHLEVSSLETFREFYIDQLGFELQATMSGALFVSAGGYHHHIGANTWHNRTAPLKGRGLSWFEIILPDSEALTAVEQRLQAHDSQFSKTEHTLSVNDPDDNEIRLTVEREN